MESSDTRRLLDALEFAAAKHRDQRRKDVEASPCINHPIALARVLSVEGEVDDVDILCAALLHDTIEDTDTTASELRDRFGERIAAIVLEFTDDKTLPKAERKELQVLHASTLSREASMVKLADKICNLRDVAKSPPAGWSTPRRQQYFDWAIRVVDGLRGVHPQLESIFDTAFLLRPSIDEAAAARVAVGVDGCKKGWLAVWRSESGQDFELRVFGTPQELLNYFGPNAVIAVDIPIGLSDAGPRTPDVLARKRLGGKRASSVFSAPIRRVLQATTRLEASNLHRAIDGRGFGAQAFGILPKIREWDEALRGDADFARVTYEVHPEVCFAELNAGAAQRDNKKTVDGQAARRTLLAEQFGVSAVRQLDSRLGRQAALDDLFDALVALWTATRIVAGQSRTLPEIPEADSAGLTRAIWI